MICYRSLICALICPIREGKEQRQALVSLMFISFFRSIDFANLSNDPCQIFSLCFFFLFSSYILKDIL
jgi:hypothetical protein